MSGYQFQGVDISILVNPGQNAPNSPYFTNLPNRNSSVVTGVYVNYNTNNSVPVNYGYNNKNTTTPLSPTNLTDYYIPYTAVFNNSPIQAVYNPPTDFKHFNAIVIGGGGGAGASGNSNSNANSGGGGGGGGGGMYLFFQCEPLSSYFPLATPGKEYEITYQVGAGGDGGINNPGAPYQSSKDGQLSFLSGKIQLIANGGSAGGMGANNNGGKDSPQAPGGPGGIGGTTSPVYQSPTAGQGNAGNAYNTGGTPATGGNGGTAQANVWGPIIPPGIYTNYGVGGLGGRPIADNAGQSGQKGKSGYIALYLFRQ